MSEHMGGARSGGGEDVDDLREIAGAHADAVTAEKKGEKTKRRRRSIRSVVAMLLATNTVLLGVLIKGAIGGPGPVAQAPVPLMAVPVPEEVMYEEPVVVQSPPPRTQQRVGPGAGGGGGGGRGGGAAPRRSSGGGGVSPENWYAPSGGLSDIFCRPRQGESQEDWAARVGNNCRR